MTVQPFSQSLMVLAAVIGLGGAIALPVQAEPQPEAPIQVAQAATPGTIIDVASGNESFETLVAAIQAAGLVETLSGEGPFTVFAPTDEAFAELPDGVVDALLKPENRDLLTEILTYHVVPGEVMSSDLETGPVETLNGGLAVRVDPDKVVVNNSSVILPDVPASNGVIHAINRVLLPVGVADELASRMQPEPIRGLW